MIHNKMALNQRQAASLLGVGIGTFREHVRPHVKYKQIGQSMLFPVTELQRWLDS